MIGNVFLYKMRFSDMQVQKVNKHRKLVVYIKSKEIYFYMLHIFMTFIFGFISVIIEKNIFKINCIEKYGWQNFLQNHVYHLFLKWLKFVLTSSVINKKEKNLNSNLIVEFCKTNFLCYYSRYTASQIYRYRKTSYISFKTLIFYSS